MIKNISWIVDNDQIRLTAGSFDISIPSGFAENYNQIISNVRHQLMLMK